MCPIFGIKASVLVDSSSNLSVDLDYGLLGKL
jgi:hypothetical protein